MALPTYLEIVNDVLTRLREPTVTTVNQNTLSTLVGKWVNDIKRQVNDAYDWDALNTSIQVTTVPGQSGGYSLAGAGLRFRINDVINTTRHWPMQGIEKAAIDRFLYLVSNPVNNPPTKFNLGGVDINGDMQVTFWPIPTGSDNIRFSFVLPEEDFIEDTDTTKMPKEPLVFGAYAKALVERGEDGGMTSSEAFAIYKQSLSDFIATEAARSPEADSWDLS